MIEVKDMSAARCQRRHAACGGPGRPELHIAPAALVLLDDRTPREFLEAVSHRDEPFNGFNLIAGDGKKLMCLASRDGVVREVEPGIHGLSNHVLDEPWPKVTQGRIELQQAMRGPLDPEAVERADGAGACRRASARIFASRRTRDGSASRSSARESASRHGPRQPG